MIINRAFVAEMYDFVLKRMNERYPLGGRRSIAAILFAIFFGEMVRLQDDGVVEAVNLSIITNPLDTLGHQSEFVPERRSYD
jgi:hypothetical protein